MNADKHFSFLKVSEPEQPELFGKLQLSDELLAEISGIETLGDYSARLFNLKSYFHAAPPLNCRLLAGKEHLLLKKAPSDRTERRK